METQVGRAFRIFRTRLGLRKAKPKDTWPWAGIEIGRHTYGVTPSSIYGYDPNVQLRVGSFCSIAHEVLFLFSHEHPIDTVSSFPLRQNLFPEERHRRIATSRGNTEVGHDVWIGRRAIIFSGVTIGNGAVIGAGSVVTRDIPPYSIAVGVPAKVIRFRFSPDMIEKLQAIQWWHWTDDEIRRNIDLITQPAERFIRGEKLLVG